MFRDTLNYNRYFLDKGNHVFLQLNDDPWYKNIKDDEDTIVINKCSKKNDIHIYFSIIIIVVLLFLIVTRFK